MKKYMILLATVLILIGCGKKQEEQSDNPPTTQEPQFHGLVRYAPMVSERGVSVDDFKYDGNEITGVIQNRSTENLDSLFLKIEFTGPSGDVEMTQPLEAVPGGDKKTVGPGFAKKVVFSFPFSHWNEEWKGIEVKITGLKMSPAE